MTATAKPEPSEKPGAVKETVEIVKTIAYALGIALVLRVLLFQPFTIPSASMVPTLSEGDYIIVSKFSYGWSKNSIPFSPPLFHGRIMNRTPERGDVIVFKLPRDGHIDYIKRLVGLPGDRIQMKAGVLYINDKAVGMKRLPDSSQETPPYGLQKPVRAYEETLPNGRTHLINTDFDDHGLGDDTVTYVVPPNCYFMMGDDRDNSADSRFDPGLPPGVSGPGVCAWNSAADAATGGELGVGFVPEENLVGKAQIVLLSWGREASLFKPWTWFTEAHFDRFFRPIK